MVVINTKYSDFVRENREAGNAQGIMAITDDEFDWLFEHGADDDGSGIIALTEEAMYRTTNLKVDLSDQGPAHVAVVKDASRGGNEHNTFMVSRSGRTSRVYDKDTIDSATIPKVTPQDANWAVRSIDFPAGKPRTMPLDLTRISSKENPAEVAFMAQVSCAQIFSALGVDVTMLIDAIDAEWGISHTAKLVSEVALADIADVSAFIATGGRPPPSVFMSPNITSAIKVVGSPTVDPKEVGFASAFTGRCKMLSKFIMASMQVFRGNDCSLYEKFNMNPAYFSKFNPKDLEGWSIDIGTAIEKSPYARTIVQNSSFDEFKNARVAVSVAVANDKSRVARIIRLVGRAETGAIAANIRPVLPSPTEQLMAGRRVEGPSVTVVPRDSDPSRLGAVLFDIYNGSATAGLYASVLGSCAMVMVLGSVTKVNLNLAGVWLDIRKSSGMGDAYAALNVSSLSRNNYLAAISAQAAGGSAKEAVTLVLLSRHLDHARNSIMAALYTSFKALKKRRKTKGAFNRPWRDFLDNITAYGSTKPFNQHPRYRKLATIASANSSLLAVDTATLAGMASSGRLDSTVTIGSGLRKHWSTYYIRASAAWQSACYVATKLSTDDNAHKRPVTATAFSNEAWESEAIIGARYAAYQELVYNTAMSLAYKWAKATVGSSGSTALTSTSAAASSAFNAAAYIAALEKHAPGSEEPSINVSVPAFKLNGNRSSDRDYTSKVNYVLTPFYSGLKPSPEDLAMAAADIDRAIAANRHRISHTFTEAMRNDLSVLRAEGSNDGSESSGSSGNFDYTQIDEALNEVKVRAEVKSVAEMLENIAPPDVSVPLSHDAQAFKDIGYSAAILVDDLDLEFRDIVKFMCESLTEKQFVDINSIVSPHVDTLRSFAHIEDDVIRFYLNKGVRSAMYEAASICGIERKAASLIR